MSIVIGVVEGHELYTVDEFVALATPWDELKHHDSFSNLSEDELEQASIQYEAIQRDKTFEVYGSSSGELPWFPFAMVKPL